MLALLETRPRSTLKPLASLLYYIAYEAAKPLASAILVPKNSQLKQLKDLKGKRITLQKGSRLTLPTRSGRT